MAGYFTESNYENAVLQLLNEELGYNYINRLRIEQAMSLLVNTNLNINEISCEVGFTYPRYFSSTFKSMTGMTPKQFRNEKCNK